MSVVSFRCRRLLHEGGTLRHIKFLLSEVGVSRLLILTYVGVCPGIGNGVTYNEQKRVVCVRATPPT